jgi:hypothetical protein
MSTRAAYFFVEDDGVRHFMVYKHHDGYPAGAAEYLTNARALGWQGDRFEADEAAAAFATAAKLASHLIVDKNNHLSLREDINDHPALRGGGVRLMYPSTDPKNLFAACRQCVDIEYAYVVSHKDSDWHVKAYITSFWKSRARKNAKQLWSGPLAKMPAWAKHYAS